MCEKPDKFAHKKAILLLFLLFILFKKLLYHEYISLSNTILHKNPGTGILYPGLELQLHGSLTVIVLPFPG